MEALARALARRRVTLGFVFAIAVLYFASPSRDSLVAGAAIGVLGEAIRIWAAGHLEKSREVTTSGPYRFIKSPMYTIGYLHTYGLAVMLRSFPGIIAAGFSQAAILAFFFIVERPHFHRLHRSS